MAVLCQRRPKTPASTATVTLEMNSSAYIDRVRRSIAMLRLGSPALDRETTMALVGELQQLEQRIRRLVDGMQGLLDEIGERQ
jgi:hypothetical protein